MNTLNKLSELCHTSVNRKARPVGEGEHNKSWNDHGSGSVELLQDYKSWLKNSYSSKKIQNPVRF